MSNWRIFGGDDNLRGAAEEACDRAGASNGVPMIGPSCGVGCPPGGDAMDKGGSECERSRRQGVGATKAKLRFFETIGKRNVRLRVT